MAEQPNPNLPASSPAIASAEAARPAARPAERRSLGRRSASLVRRWARDTFNREQLLSSLRSLAWVAPLTLLIWIYAEREQQATLPARFQIVVKSANPSQIATSPEQNVMATLKGPKARLEAVIEKLDPRSNAGAVQIVVDGNRQPGQQYEVDIVAQVQKDFRLDGSGITVQDCTPRQIRVDVDALQEVELEVRADPQLRLPTKPTFDPPKVKVTAPAATLRAAKGDYYAKANLPNLPPGPHSLKSVPVTVEGLDPKLQARPGTVAATVELGQADMEYTIPSVPVFPLVEADPQVMETHKLRFEQFVPTVVVVGPPDKIKRLEDPTAKPRPKARFEVTDLDVGKQRLTRELKFELPEGISLKDAAPRTITFDLMPKDPS